MEYTIADLRVAIAEINGQLKNLQRQNDTLVEEVTSVKNDITRWKGALGIAAFLVTSMSSVITTLVNKFFFGAT